MRKNLIGILFLIILALAIGVRLIGLDRCFVTDEFRTIQISKLSVSGILGGALDAQSYPPFVFIALSFWLRVLDNDIWIRLLFVIFGVFSVLVTYRIGREISGERYALIAMFFASIMPMQAWISQYIRGISPAILFMLLSTLFFIRLIKDTGRMRWPDLTGYAVSAILAVYSFYFSFFILLAQNILIAAKRRADIKYLTRWLLCQIAICAAFLPWLNTFLWQMGRGNVGNNYSVVSGSGLTLFGLSVGSYIRGLACLFGIDETFLANTALARDMDFGVKMFITAGSFIILAVFFLLYARIYRRLKGEGRISAAGGLPAIEILKIFSFFALIAFIFSVILNALFKTPVAGRYYAPSSAFIIFVYALIVSRIKSKAVFRFIMAGFVLVSLWRIADFTKTSIDYKGAAVFVHDNIKDDECLLFIEGDGCYEHYRPFPPHYIATKKYISKYKSGGTYRLEDLVNTADLYAETAPFKKLWIYHSGELMVGRLGYVRRFLEDHGYRQTGEIKFKNIDIFRYEKTI